MTVMELDKNMHVGIVGIDEQHKALADLMNIIAEAAVNRARPRDLDVLLRKLIDDFRKHYEYEHALMDSMNYATYKLHMNEHDRSLRLLGEFRDKVAADGAFSQNLFESYVVRVFRNHVICIDKTLGDFVRERSA